MKVLIIIIPSNCMFKTHSFNFNSTFATLTWYFDRDLSVSGSSDKKPYLWGNLIATMNRLVIRRNSFLVYPSREDTLSLHSSRILLIPISNHSIVSVYIFWVLEFNKFRFSSSDSMPSIHRFTIFWWKDRKHQIKQLG